MFILDQRIDFDATIVRHAAQSAKHGGSHHSLADDVTESSLLRRFQKKKKTQTKNERSGQPRGGAPQGSSLVGVGPSPFDVASRRHRVLPDAGPRSTDLPPRSPLPRAPPPTALPHLLSSDSFLPPGERERGQRSRKESSTAVGASLTGGRLNLNFKFNRRG